MYPTQLPPPITPLADLLALSVSSVPGGAWPDSSSSSTSSSSSSSSLSKRRLKRKQRSRGNMDPVEVITLT
jgi:hypothetical protein